MGWFGRGDAAFDNQFSRDDSGLTYRRWSYGPAYRITETEHDEFQQTFRRTRRLNSLLTFLGIMTIIGGMVVWSMSNHIDPESQAFSVAMWVLLPLCMGPFLFFHMRSYTAPARDLERRVAVAPALNKAERKQQTLSKLSYGQLALAPLLPLLLLQGRTYSLDVWHGWGRLWWLLFLGLTGLAVFQAYRKWRQSRSG